MLRSRDNPQVKRWARLIRETGFRRAEGRVVVEGPHLIASLLAQGIKPSALLATQEALETDEIASLARQSGLTPVVLSASVFRTIADAQTPPGVAAEIAMPAIRRDGFRVFLEGVQDAGNVGAIVRSAAAFGAGAVILDRACADPWSPKVLRAGMGGHFAIQITQVDELDSAISSFAGRLVCAVPRGGTKLREADLSGRVGWLFGSEGAGVSPALQQRAALKVTIPTKPETESLNVAAAAAICLYEAFSRPGGGS